MKKKYILFTLIAVVFFILLLNINTKTYAADLDEIVNYIVTVEPRTNDGSLDITYEITWKVLDSTTEGPLEWVKIGTPNDSFDSPTALSSNIKSIKKYSGSLVRIDFDKKYYAGDVIIFKYSIHQPYMYTVSWGKCNYEFTPAWFTDAKVDHLTIKWNKDKVKSHNSNIEEENYIIWNKKNMAKGEKLTAKVKYEKTAFSALTSQKRSSDTIISRDAFVFIVFGIIFFSIALASIFGGGGYYGHRGFYGGGYGRGSFYGGCVRSSCACASSCASSCAHSSCACACAGSGRAGCSRKDFYGTNITTKKMKEAFKN